MKTPIRAIAAAALLTVLAGCASTQASSSPASPAGNDGSTSAGAPSDGSSPSASSGEGTPTAPTPASPPSSTGGANPGVPLPPVSTTAPNGDRIVYVSPDGITVGADGKTLSTSVEWGGCQDQPQLVVFGQNAHQVVVEVKTVKHFKMGQMCPNIERTGTATATLSAPLGNRQVVDGLTGRAVVNG